VNNSDLGRCLDIAVREFDRHRADTFKHWSFIFQKGKLLEWGQNRLGDPTGLNKFGYRNERHSIHAEAMAYRKARGLLDRRREWVCVNVRLGSKKEPRESCPCSLCQHYFYSLGGHDFWYTTDSGWFKRLDTRIDKTK